MSQAPGIVCHLDVHGKDTSLLLLEEDLFETHQDPDNPTNHIVSKPHSLRSDFKERIVKALIDDHYPVHQYRDYIQQYLLQGGKIKVLNINGDMNCTQPNTFRHQYLECNSKGRSITIKLVPPSEMYQFLHLRPRDPPPAPTNRLFPEAQVPASAPHAYDKEPWIGQYYDPTNLLTPQLQTPLCPSYMFMCLIQSWLLQVSQPVHP